LPEVETAPSQQAEWNRDCDCVWPRAVFTDSITPTPTGPMFVALLLLSSKRWKIYTTVEEYSQKFEYSQKIYNKNFAVTEGVILGDLGFFSNTSLIHRWYNLYPHIRLRK